MVLRRVRWIVRGDIDGFFGLALDNLVQLLLIDALCRGVLGFPGRPRLRPHPAGRGGLDPRRQRLLRVSGQATGGAHRPHRRLRAALRHQHRVALRARLPGDAAGQDAGDRGGRAGSGARSRGRPGSSRRSASGRDRAGRARSSPSGSARRRRARRCSRRSPASRSASSRSASSSARSRARSSA